MGGVGSAVRPCYWWTIHFKHLAPPLRGIGCKVGKFNGASVTRLHINVARSSLWSLNTQTPFSCSSRVPQARRQGHKSPPAHCSRARVCVVLAGALFIALVCNTHVSYPSTTSSALLSGTRWVMAGLSLSVLNVATGCLRPDSGVISIIMTLHLVFISHFNSWADEMTPISASLQK